MASSRLNLKRNADIAWMREFINPDGAGKYQTCVGGRETEDSAIQRMAYPDPYPATNSNLHINGMLADLNTQLYCRGCKRYLFDREFKKDVSRLSRRGRAYTCKTCERKKSTIT
jgi:hypothetical protein